MEVVPLTPTAFDRWNQFAELSDDAWFWQTTHWMEFTQELSSQKFLENLSFFIMENSEVLAICPLIMEEENGERSFSYSGGPVPLPAFKNGIETVKREKILKYYARTLETLALEKGVVYVSVKIPSVARSYLKAAQPVVNPLLKLGYFDLPYLTQVIDLWKSPEELWADVQKGHKSDIKRGAGMCSVKVWDHENVSEDKFHEYQELHRKDAGRVTRSHATFDLMRFWVKQGNAALVEANCEGHAVAFALLILFGAGVYYGSSCKDPDYPDIAASHLIQWESILWLRRRGFHFYDIGLQQFGPQWFDIPSRKSVNISKFKRGFGGMTIPLMTAEFYFSREYLERVFRDRLREYLSCSRQRDAR